MALPNILKSYQTPMQIAWQALLRNKVRTVLSVLGVVIGIAAVIIVLSAGQAIKGFMVNQLTSFGTDYIQVEIKVPNTAHTSAENASGLAYGVQVTTLKDSDREAILKLNNVKDAYSGTLGQAVVSYNGTNNDTFIFAVSPSFINIDPSHVAEGRFFTDDEDKSLDRVVVLGADLKKTLFGDDEAVGQDVKVGKSSYKVIGVMARKGSASFLNFDQMIYMPINTAQKLVLGYDYVTYIFVKVYDNSIAPATADDITQLLRERHDISGNDTNKDDFAVTTQAEAMDILDTIVGAITLLLIAIAGISLVVGGVGIMNIMYVSVAERTFEIGLRKAVGARKNDILTQFLLEAIFVTFTGGIIGILIGTLVSWLISFIANFLGYNWGFYISIWYFLLAAGVSIGVGVISGIYPARTAAGLDPIVALRQE